MSRSLHGPDLIPSGWFPGHLGGLALAEGHPHSHGHVGGGRLLSTITAEDISAGDVAARKMLRDVHIWKQHTKGKLNCSWVDIENHYLRLKHQK